MTSRWRPGGHLGSSVSALVDGQLDAASTERAWDHVMNCAPCRRVVEHESWVKRQLAQIADGPRAERPSDRFLGSLLELDPNSADPAATAWAETDELERRGRTHRRAGIALVGAGSVSAAVFGLSAIGATPMGIGGTASTPPPSMGGATTSSTPTPAVVAPAASVHGRLRGWTLGSGDSDARQARAVDHSR